jgi:hypothetical protein
LQPVIGGIVVCEEWDAESLLQRPVKLAVHLPCVCAGIYESVCVTTQVKEEMQQGRRQKDKPGKGHGGEGDEEEAEHEYLDGSPICIASQLEPAVELCQNAALRLLTRRRTGLESQDRGSAE